MTHTIDDFTNILEEYYVTKIISNQCNVSFLLLKNILFKKIVK